MKNFALLLCPIALLCACGEVVAPGGNAADASPAPTAESVSPDHGPVIGGVEITISGARFEAGEPGDTQVVVGGNAATDVAVSGDTVTFTLPPGGVEGDLVDVTVFNQNGFAVLPDAFRYNERPVVLSISPERGRGAGGTNITIIGRGFEDLEAGTNTVTLAGAAATNVVVVDDQTITATTGVSTAPGFVPDDVIVANANGEARLTAGFEVTQPGLLAFDRSSFQRIFYVDPASGNSIEIGRADRRVRGCAINLAGTVFCVGRRASDNQFELFTIDPLTGTDTPIGLTNLAAVNRGLDGLAFVGNTLYATANGPCCSGPFNFVSVNVTTGVLTSLGTWAAARPGGAGIAPRDATTLWYVDEMNQTLDTMAVANGVVTAGIALGGQQSNTRGLSIVNGVLYMTDRDRSRVYTVNTTTGAVTDFASFPTAVKAIVGTPPTF